MAPSRVRSRTRSGARRTADRRPGPGRRARDRGLVAHPGAAADASTLHDDDRLAGAGRDSRCHLRRSRLLGDQRHPEHRARQARQGGGRDQSEPGHRVGGHLLVRAHREGRPAGSQGLRGQRRRPAGRAPAPLHGGPGRSARSPSRRVARRGRGHRATRVRGGGDLPAAVSDHVAVSVHRAHLRQALLRARHLARRREDLRADGRQGTARDLRDGRREAERAQLRGGSRHLHRAEGPRPRLSGVGRPALPLRNRWSAK